MKTDKQYTLGLSLFRLRGMRVVTCHKISCKNPKWNQTSFKKKKLLILLCNKCKMSQPQNWQVAKPKEEYSSSNKIYNKFSSLALFR